MQGKTKQVIWGMLRSIRRALGPSCICRFTHLLGFWQPVPAAAAGQALLEKLPPPAGALQTGLLLHSHRVLRCPGAKRGWVQGQAISLTSATASAVLQRD